MREIKFKTYLLGTSSEPERTAIDRSLLTDGGEFELFLLAEDELIEAYIQQELSPVERTQFEQCFLLADPERQQKLRLALALHRYANDAAKSLPDKVRAAKVKAAVASTAAEPWWAVFRRPVWQLAMAGGVLVVALVGVRVYFNPTESSQIAHGSPSPTLTVTPTTVPRGTAVLSVQLLPGRTRAIGTRDPQVELLPDTGTLNFMLGLSSDSYSSYDVILIVDDEEGQKLAGPFKPQTTQDGNYVIVSVPVSMLGKGEHRIKLAGVTPNGIEQAGVYYFTIKR
jgi:hypothetical protein